jgi:hypothetical protein
MLLIGSGVAILLPPYATLRFGDLVISVNTLGGISALVLGSLMLVCAGLVWARPRWAWAGGIAAVLAALVALVTANLGGFLVGTLLGLTGGALAVAWTDSPARVRRARPGVRRVVRRRRQAVRPSDA